MSINQRLTGHNTNTIVLLDPSTEHFDVWVMQNRPVLVGLRPRWMDDVCPPRSLSLAFFFFNGFLHCILTAYPSGIGRLERHPSENGVPSV
jgi:hypothetical protein